MPAARGLGSSVTVIAGVLAGLDTLHGTGWSRHQFVELATAIEGHPDNASAGVLGGFCVSRCDPATGAYLGTVRASLFRPSCSRLWYIGFAGVRRLTKESRGALPATLPYFDAVKSINSAAYLTAAFATGEFAKLRHAGGDFMHEPYRLPKIRGAAAALAAGTAAGAYTGWLSGSGSSVLCRQSGTPRPNRRGWSAAMRGAFAQIGGVQAWMACDNTGARNQADGGLERGRIRAKLSH